MRCIAIIPARSALKGLSNKNIKELEGEACRIRTARNAIVNRQRHLDILRIMATYAVVLLHTASKKIAGGGVLLLYDGLVRWAVPMFVMISGALMLDPERKLTIAGLWKKNIPRMILSLWFWSSIYCIWETVINYKDGNYVLQTMVMGYWHMWYIFMIITLYALTPALRLIVREKKTLEYVLWIALVLSFIMPTVRTMIQYSSFVEYPAISGIVNHYDIIDWKLAVSYIPFFFLGYYLNTVDIERRYRFTAYLLGIIGFAWNIYFNYRITYQNGTPIKEFYDALRVPVLLQCVGMFVLFKYRGVHRHSERLSKLSKYTFGAYMVHLLIREVLDHFFGLNAETYRFILWTPILALVIFTLSILISAVINHIPVLNKNVV